MTIADQIRALKPGDRIRVTFENDVALIDHVGDVKLADGEWLLPGDCSTIISIEVIERPLAVGDRVALVGAPSCNAGRIRGIDGDEAWVKWDDLFGYGYIQPLSDLRRITP